MINFQPHCWGFIFLFKRWTALERRVNLSVVMCHTLSSWVWLELAEHYCPSSWAFSVRVCWRESLSFHMPGMHLLWKNTLGGHSRAGWFSAFVTPKTPTEHICFLIFQSDPRLFKGFLLLPALRILITVFPAGTEFLYLVPAASSLDFWLAHKECLLWSFTWKNSLHKPKMPVMRQLVAYDSRPGEVCCWPPGAEDWIRGRGGQTDLVDRGSGLCCGSEYRLLLTGDISGKSLCSIEKEKIGLEKTHWRREMGRPWQGE